MWKPIFILLSSLAILPVQAEKVGDVEFTLPPAARNWELGAKMEKDDPCTTVIYVPRVILRQNIQEFFGISTNNKPTENLHEEVVLHASLSKQYPNMNMDLLLLETDSDSVIYEWLARVEGRECIHGWDRIFSSPKGTTVLRYQTQKVSDVRQAREDWLPVLQEATLN